MGRYTNFRARNAVKRRLPRLTREQRADLVITSHRAWTPHPDLVENADRQGHKASTAAVEKF